MEILLHRLSATVGIVQPRPTSTLLPVWPSSYACPPCPTIVRLLSAPSDHCPTLVCPHNGPLSAPLLSVAITLICHSMLGMLSIVWPESRTAFISDKDKCAKNYDDISRWFVLPHPMPYTTHGKRFIPKSTLTLHWPYYIVTNGARHDTTYCDGTSR